MRQFLNLSALTHVNTWWAKPWFILVSHQIGPPHFRDGKVCQDAYLVEQIPQGILLGVADGVGSCEQALQAAQLTLRFLADALVKKSSVAMTTDLLRQAIGETRSSLFAYIEAHKGDPMQYGSTLAVSLITQDTVYSASLGDSMHVALKGPVLPDDPPLAISPLCSSNQRAENNKTFALVRDDWEPNLQTISTPFDNLDGLLIASDGADPYFMHDLGFTAPSRFANDFIETLPDALAQIKLDRIQHSWSALNFLTLEGKTNKTLNTRKVPVELDDDCTFLIALKLPSDLHPGAL